MREAAIARNLHHPFVCGMRDMLITPNHYYLFFEYVNGGQLLDYIISHGKMKEKHARKFARQIGSALDYCHRNAIAHRDLKIENILISKSGNIKLIDFGLANLYNTHDLLKTFCGSLYFAAPELLNAKPYIGPEVDVWSFGIVIFVLVCGKVPFDDQHMATLHAKIKRGVVDYPMWLTSECKHLLSRMLVVNPAHRATLTEVLNHPWMVRGFDGPPENYAPTRKPMTAADPIDPDIVKDMQGFEFGSEQVITEKLSNILASKEYDDAVKAYYSQPDTKKKVNGWKKLIGGGTDKENGPIYPDPTQAFNPVLAVYYLVREKRERERLAAARGVASPFASSDTSLPGQANPQPADIAVPTITQPANTHASNTSHDINGRGNVKVAPVPPIKITHATPRARANGNDDFLSPVDEGAASPETPFAPSSPMQVQSAGLPPRRSVSGATHRKGAASMSMTSPPPGDPQSPLKSAPMGATPFSQRFSSMLNRATSVNEADYRKHRHRGSFGGSKQGTKQPVAQLPQVVEVESPQSPPLPEKDDAMPPLHPKSKSLREPTSAHSRSVSMAEMSPGNRASMTPVQTPVQTPAQLTSPPDTPGKANESNKPVFLKGLFSVQTTSSKPIDVIREDIVQVLTQLGVHFREVKGGFECVHMPSIQFSSLSQSTPADSSPRRSMSVRRKTPATPQDQVDTEDLVVRFDINIVKITWLMGINGIQFRRVGGDSWSYKRVATSILQQLKL